MNNLACAFTGHRPSRFSFGYNEDDERCIKIKTVMTEQINTLISNGVTEFCSGMALGVDQWAAEIVLEIKKSQPNLRLIAVRPCETQADRWSAYQRERHYDTLAQCDVVMTLQTKYTYSCISARNRYLVDHTKYLLAIYDGSSNGGTAYTVRYARQQGRQVISVNPETLAVI